ncbi:MAG: hypothetical protein LW822_09660 [Phycisphaeraceae bacterium]|jgi:HSP90 family molecular chaperone|nr:hypothetical protein [Phycisphaeraceae bacterium]
MSVILNVDLRGNIDLAANHLYSSPDVFGREVIQNASVGADGADRLDLPDRTSGSKA